MGRHSAPEDTDEDVDTDVRTVDDGAGTADATGSVPEPDGRHANRVDSRPRPTPDAVAVEHDPRPEGLSLLDHAFGPEPADAGADAPTTTMDLSELARADRPLPEETTVRIAPIVDAPARPAPPPVPAGATVTDVPPGAAAVPAPAHGRHATRADLALIRRHGDVRARVVAAVLAPFVVFVAVFVVRGDLDLHSLVWIWVPAVVAGVLVGVLLDAGHKRYPADPSRTGP